MPMNSHLQVVELGRCPRGFLREAPLMIKGYVIKKEVKQCQ